MRDINIEILNNGYSIPFENNIVSIIEKMHKLFNIKNITFITIEFCSSEQIKDINKEYRNKNSDTDVLSFEYYENLKDNINQYQDQILNLGDILISHDYVLEQASFLNHTFEEEVIFLVIHGFLHLLGYDHLNIDDSSEMIRKQKEIFGDFHERNY